MAHIQPMGMTDATELAALEPCPFCGGEAALVRMEDEDGEFAVVSCQQCGCATRQSYFLGGDPERDVESAWNTRALASRDGGGWQSIESAPSEGLHVRGLWIRSIRAGQPDTMDWRAFVGYVDDAGRFVDPDYQEDFGWEAEDYEGWQPLPPPPAKAAPLAGAVG